MTNTKTTELEKRVLDLQQNYPVKDMTSAKMIADSINKQDDRLMSFVTVFPRYILAELNTHRAFSRNSASSRAIPMPKMIRSIKENPFMPQLGEWMKEHTGMQGYEFFTPEEVVQKRFIKNWLFDRDYAIHQAEGRYEDGLSKQIGNRHLESFMWHQAIVSMTELENFLSLRVSPMAEPHFRKLANMMLDAANASTPKSLKAGEWHIPFGEDIDEALLLEAIKKYINEMMLPIIDITDDHITMFKVKVAVARCARVSYTIVGTDVKHDYYADFKLYDRLDEQGHYSPFENVARAMTDMEYHANVRGHRWMNGTVSMFEKESLGWLGNFKGFIQARKQHKQENRKDDRLIKHTFAA